MRLPSNSLHNMNFMRAFHGSAGSPAAVAALALAACAGQNAGSAGDLER